MGKGERSKKRKRKKGLVGMDVEHRQSNKETIIGKTNIGIVGTKRG